MGQLGLSVGTKASIVVIGGLIDCVRREVKNAAGARRHPDLAWRSSCPIERIFHKPALHHFVIIFRLIHQQVANRDIVFLVFTHLWHWAVRDSR